MTNLDKSKKNKDTKRKYITREEVSSIKRLDFFSGRIVLTPSNMPYHHIPKRAGFPIGEPLPPPPRKQSKPNTVLPSIEEPVPVQETETKTRRVPGVRKKRTETRRRRITGASRVAGVRKRGIVPVTGTKTGTKKTGTVSVTK